jgi:hypothetical protein
MSSPVRVIERSAILDDARIEPTPLTVRHLFFRLDGPRLVGDILSVAIRAACPAAVDAVTRPIEE